MVLSLNFQTPFKRQKRQVRADLRAAEKSGVKVLDYGYGADLNTESELSIYPTLMGELLDEQNAFGGNNGHQKNQNAFDDHNQLGILREGSNQASATEKPLQSAYSRVNQIGCKKYNFFCPKLRWCTL